MNIAALRHDGSLDMDTLLAQAAARAQTAGLRVRGLVMTWPDGAAACGAMVLKDVQTGESFLVSQDLGPGATGCRVDTQGFARASVVLRRALDEQPLPDLVVINRFGGLEAEGEGLAEELMALVAAEVPVLTAVADKHAQAWARFSGEWPLMEPQALPGWLDGLARR
ncbi:MAG: DUF2478 domain-containing protein [Burkholderiales bacterium]|nr:DUF2478 domain-containing protein [Burkholderiales bacterium]